MTRTTLLLTLLRWRGGRCCVYQAPVADQAAPLSRTAAVVCWAQGSDVHCVFAALQLQVAGRGGEGGEHGEGCGEETFGWDSQGLGFLGWGVCLQPAQEVAAIHSSSGFCAHGTT